MKRLKMKDISGMKEEEMAKKMLDLRKELMKNRAQVATGSTPKDPNAIKNIKKTIARMLTELNARQRTVDAKKTAPDAKTSGSKKQ